MKKVNINFDVNLWQNLGDIAKTNGFSTKAAFVRKCVDIVVDDLSLFSPIQYDDDNISLSEYKQMQEDNMKNNEASRSAINYNIASVYNLMIKISDKLGVDLRD